MMIERILLTFERILLVIERLMDYTVKVSLVDEYFLEGICCIRKN